MTRARVLTDLAFNILVALVDGDLHGYALLKRLREQEGRGSLRAGTIYAALARLEDEGWVRDVDPPHGAGDDERRRYWRITGEGGAAVRAEAARLAGVVARARRSALLPDPPPHA